MCRYLAISKQFFLFEVFLVLTLISMVSVCYGIGHNYKRHTQAELDSKKSVWVNFDQKIETDKRYASLLEDVKKTRFTMHDVGDPYPYPPLGFFSQIMHLYLNLYTNHLADWLDYCQEHGSEGTVTLFNEKLSFDEGFYKYLEGEDPLLMPILAFLLHLVWQGVVSVSEDDLTYIKFRLRWVDETMLTDPEMAIVWEDEYKDLIEDSQEWWGNISHEIPLWTTTQQRGVVFKKIPRKEQKYIRDYFKQVSDFPEELVLRSVWHFCLFLADSGFLAKDYNRDPLMDHLAGFVFNAALSKGGYLLRERDRRLTAWWIQHVAFEEGKASEAHRKRWLTKMQNYKLPGTQVDLSTPEPGQIQSSDYVLPATLTPAFHENLPSEEASGNKTINNDENISVSSNQTVSEISQQSSMAQDCAELKLVKPVMAVIPIVKKKNKNHL